MSEDPSAALQLTRLQHHLSIQYNARGRALAHWLHLSCSKPMPPQVERALLHQMDRVGPSHYTGVFYTGGTLKPYVFLFDFSSEIFSFIGHPCTPEQAEQRFHPCPLPDFSSPEEYTAIVLHYADGAYRPDPQYPLSTDERHLVRRCLRLNGPDFPGICFRWSSPVQWFLMDVPSGLPRCHKLYLIPLCAAHHQVLLLHRIASPEETMRSLCHIPDTGTPHLTPREQQTLELARQGLPNRAIAALLRIQEGTVKKLLSGVYAKLGIHSRYDLLRLNRE